MTDTKIYKITSNHTENIFIGSTIRTLTEIEEEHAANYNRYLKDNTNNYCTSFELIKQPTYEILLIEEVNVEGEADLSKIKGTYIKNTPNCVNKQIAGRTQEQWNKDNQEHRSKLAKERYQNNKEDKKLKTKEYYQNNKEELLAKQREKIECECSGNYSRSQEARHYKTVKHQNYIKTKNA